MMSENYIPVTPGQDGVTCEVVKENFQKRLKVSYWYKEASGLWMPGNHVLLTGQELKELVKK